MRGLSTLVQRCSFVVFLHSCQRTCLSHVHTTFRPINVCHQKMNVYTACEHGAVKEQGLTPIGTRRVFTNKGHTEHLFIRARLVAQETKRTTKMDLTDTSMTFAATPPVEGFRFLLSRAMSGEKKRNPQDELIIAFFDISRAHFHSPVRRKVAIRMQGDPSCPSGIAMLNRAMYGTKDAAQCFDSYCERTMEKLDYNIGVFNPCLYKNPVKDISVLRHGDDFATLATRTQIAEFKEELSKHLLVKHIATLVRDRNSLTHVKYDF